MSGLMRNTIRIGDAVEQLRQLPDESVDTVMTSPPYALLRDYGVEGQYGLEETVHGWVDNLLAVGQELARVLKPSGSWWLNVGDSYSRHARYGAPPKGLLLGPERLLLALSEQGWIVRNKVTWAKANPMPSSVKDRFGSGWEPVYFLVRSGRYYFDLDGGGRVPHRSGHGPGNHMPASRVTRPDWVGPLAGDNAGLARLKAAGIPGHPLGANARDVWTIATSSYRGGNHAVFPEELVRRVLKVACPQRVCGSCGQPWWREPARRLGHLAVLGELLPVCSCQSAWQPGLVLDPFMGAGTTGVVARKLGLDWLGIELNPEFAARALERIAGVDLPEQEAA